ncbi:PAS domain S-box protein [Methanolobus chelungpuianus]
MHDKGTILDCNQSLAEMSEYTVGELTGMKGLLLIAEDFHDDVMKDILCCLEEPYEVMARVEARGRKGSTFISVIVDQKPDLR